MRRIRTFGKAVLGLGVLTLALSSCIKMDMDMKITKDEKIDGSAIIAFSTQILEMSGQKKADIVKEMKADWKDLPKGSKAEIYDKDGFIGQKLTFKGMPVSEFSKATQSAGSSTPTGAGEDDMKLVKEGGNWKFTGTLDMSGGMGTETTVKGQKSDAPDFSPLMAGMKVKIKMTFPGKILKHDKDGKVSGNSITWEPKAGQKVVMMAVAKTS